MKLSGILILIVGSTLVRGQLYPIDVGRKENVDELRIPNVRQNLEDCHTRYYRYARNNLASPVLGTPVELGEFAHMAAIGWSQDGGEIDWKCGGSLIADNWVLTAGHCTFFRGVAPDKVRLGDRNPFTKLDDDIAQQFDIVEVVRHPEYNSSRAYNDMALLRLSSNIRPQKNVLPACLWTDQNNAFIDDFQYEAIGFGLTGFNGDLAEVFQKVSLNYVHLEECQKLLGTGRKYPDGILEQQMCARGLPQGDLRPDTCQGDSGGPIQVKLLSNGRMTSFIVGVTSFGKTCGAEEPGVYARVSAFKAFIERTTRISFEPRKCVLRYVSLREFQPGLLEIGDRSNPGNHSNWINAKVHIARDYRHKSYLGKKTTGDRFHWYCGASLISERWLLTAAHCVMQKPDIAQVGDLRIYSNHDDQLAQRFEIEQAITHPSYKESDVYDDIGLVKLKGFVKISIDIVPACIWKKEKLPTDSFEVVGWGSRVSNLFFIDLPVWEVGNDEVFPLVTTECDEKCQVERTRTLENVVDQYKSNKDEVRYLEINSTVLDNFNCNLHYLTKKDARPIRDTQMCLQNDLFAVPGICDLDIGGPVERKVYSYYEYDSYVFGVNSFGKNCGFGTPAVATRVSSYADWIESQVLNQTKSASADRNVDSEIFFLDNHDTKSSGDACFIPGDSKPGTCIVDSDCSGGISYYRSQGKQVQICAFGRQTLICCPSGLSNRAGDEKISLRQCQNHPDLRASPKPGPRENGKVFAHLAAVGFQKGSRHEFKCWGALVSDSFVVTSATCFTINPSQPRVVRLGDHNVGLSATETLANVLRVVSHPMYRPRFYYYDVALLQIQPVTFSAHVAPACIWPHENEVPFVATVPAPASLDSVQYACKTTTCDVLNPIDKERNLLLMQQDACQYKYPVDSVLTEGVVDSQVCAQAETLNSTDSCIRVPGSLLQKGVVENGKVVPYIVGLHSFDRNCNQDNPAIFTRLTSYIHWIEKTINENVLQNAPRASYLPSALDDPVPLGPNRVYSSNIKISNSGV